MQQRLKKKGQKERCRMRTEKDQARRANKREAELALIFHNQGMSFTNVYQIAMPKLHA